MVTKKKQEAVLAAVKKQFKAWTADGYEPKLVDDYEGTPAVVWEDGAPYDWTLLVNYGGIEEEFGFEVEKADLPDGVWVEPYNGCVLSIYDG